MHLGFTKKDQTLSALWAEQKQRSPVARLVGVSATYGSISIEAVRSSRDLDQPSDLRISAKDWFPHWFEVVHRSPPAKLVLILGHPDVRNINIVVSHRLISNRQDHTTLVSHCQTCLKRSQISISPNCLPTSMVFRLQHCLGIMGLLKTAVAVCMLPGVTGDLGTLPSDFDSPKLCVPQGEGYWTFALYVIAVDVPAPQRGVGLEGFASGSQYLIYDNTCTLKGVWDTSAGDCGIPFTIEANFLKDVLTIRYQTAAIGSPYFDFVYGNGEFSIGNNHCGCQDMSVGLTAQAGCKCAFPVDGIL